MDLFAKYLPFFGPRGSMCAKEALLRAGELSFRAGMDVDPVTLAESGKT